MKIYFPKMISLVILASFSIVFWRCSDDDKPSNQDTTKPTITTTMPVKGQQYNLNGPFKYQGTFADETDLDLVLFSLTDNKPTSLSSIKVSTGIDDDPWKPDDHIITLSGKSQSVEEAIFDNPIPKDIYTGSYTLTIKCMDKAGNEIIETIDVEIL